MHLNLDMHSALLLDILMSHYYHINIILSSNQGALKLKFMAPSSYVSLKCPQIKKEPSQKKSQIRSIQAFGSFLLLLLFTLWTFKADITTAPTISNIIEVDE